MTNNNNNSSGNNIKTLIIDNIKYRTRLTQKFLKRNHFKPTDPKKVLSFIPGAIKKVNVKVGSRVKINDRLMELEAMKMNNYILSPLNGIVKKVYVKAGDKVPKAFVLLEFK